MFRLWAVLQEKIATTPYGPDRIVFRSPLVLNTIQSFIAAILAALYLRIGNKKHHIHAVFSKGLIQKYLLLAATTSIGSWFGYQSLHWVDYPTMVLAKSSKLLPVMFIHVVMYRTRFPGYKYVVVGLITSGVGLFTLFHPVEGTAKAATSSAWGLFLLALNLMADGFMNSTQDQMFSSNKKLTGPQMMLGLNASSTALTLTYLLLTYFFSQTSSEITKVVRFTQLHPQVMVDILLFALAGAIGQVFIFLTLSVHGSLILVTITVTRKLFTMLLSVLWFNHRLNNVQWVGVCMVFGGIGLEAYWARRAKLLTKSQFEAAQNGKLKKTE